jgi:hypothetical protein
MSWETTKIFRIHLKLQMEVNKSKLIFLEESSNKYKTMSPKTKAFLIKFQLE